ncbi:uncharacterized protein LOC131666721 isoform X2 [Phymastichus coffea]|uniref:uncharacterized protein LOC131666721 isoform X2 n=1 Tax=Phymastichus coffea TaxID=108790 RepID=UPI00273AD529|nr:uncharacterized protein LOC131666721 isoform X2 [Phymastichus coffea]
MQKPLRELSRLWHGTNNQASNNQPTILTEVCSSEPASGLPLLQVWPSDSPRGEADGETFVFPDVQENINDSGIESIQASPSPGGANGAGGGGGGGNSPTQGTTPQQSRRSSFLHPDHARLHHHRIVVEKPSMPDYEEPQPPSPSSSTTSSLRSVPSSAMTSMSQSHERRRSSRYSMFDALDLEYALLRAAARGSVGPYSLSESLHKLTFTQSLAFPALARGLASKKSEAEANGNCQSDGHQRTESGMNVFAKIVTALVLVLVSVLVFGVVYKFVRT